MIEISLIIIIIISIYIVWILPADLLLRRPSDIKYSWMQDWLKADATASVKQIQSGLMH